MFRDEEATGYLQREMCSRKMWISFFNLSHFRGKDFLSLPAMQKFEVLKEVCDSGDYSRPAHYILRDGNKVNHTDGLLRGEEDAATEHSSVDHDIPPSRSVGLDPGLRNIATMVDTDGNVLRYTSRQRRFESKLARYRSVLHKEKRRGGMEILEARLSVHSSRTNNAENFWSYLIAKKEFDASLAKDFYLRTVWRNWRLRVILGRSSSEKRFLERVASTYGSECHIYYGDWSRKDHKPGHAPSPNAGPRKAMKKRFLVTDVDEHLTSRTCNRCAGKLTSYVKWDGKRSFSRLCCTGCGRQEDGTKWFVDRDENAAANILTVGLSLPLRPKAMRRRRRRRRGDQEQGTSIKSEEIGQTVDLVGTSSDSSRTDVIV